MLKISVISYKSTILRVHQSVFLKYLRFPDQHMKRNIDTPNETGYKGFYGGVTAPRMNPLPIYIPFFDCFIHDLGGGGGLLLHFS